MKKVIYCLFVLLGLQSFNVSAADLKIAVVDVRAGVMQSTAAKLKMEKLKPEFAKEEAEIMALRDELKKLEERIKKDGAVMSAEEKRKLEKEFVEKGNELKFKGQQFQQSSQSEAQEVFKSLLPKFQEALKSIVEANKYDVVLHREAAIFVKPEYEITEQVMKKMDSMK